MRYLILSDLHANLPALEAALRDAAPLGYDAVLLLGDLVGYGADPSAVMARAFALEPEALIRGNHDKVCAGLESAEHFNDTARRSVEWTHRTLSADELKQLAAMPTGPRVISPSLEICHGSPFDEDYYIFDARDAQRAMQASQSRICLFGHTHVPAVFAARAQPARTRTDLADDEIELPHEGPVLINVGSVGQPRDGDPRAAYGLLDLERQVVRLRRVVYDVAAAQASILAAGLPPALAARLERGQ